MLPDGKILPSPGEEGGNIRDVFSGENQKREAEIGKCQRKWNKRKHNRIIYRGTIY
jgi:hypothetical protein